MACSMRERSGRRMVGVDRATVIEGIVFDEAADTVVVHVQADEVADLVHQVRGGRDLEAVLPPRLEPEGPPYLPHGGVADPVLGGQTPRRPVRGTGGADSRVSTITDSTTSSPMLRAAPGRGASASPSRRSAAKRRRRLPTVTGLHPSSSAISEWVRPSAQPKTIRQRSANACDDFCPRAQRSSVARSSGNKVISTVGRPRRAMLILRCLSTTPDQRGPNRKIPDQTEFLG